MFAVSGERSEPGPRIVDLDTRPAEERPEPIRLAAERRDLSDRRWKGIAGCSGRAELRRTAPIVPVPSECRNSAVLDGCRRLNKAARRWRNRLPKVDLCLAPTGFEENKHCGNECSQKAGSRPFRADMG